MLLPFKDNTPAPVLVRVLLAPALVTIEVMLRESAVTWTVESVTRTREPENVLDPLRLLRAPLLAEPAPLRLTVMLAGTIWMLVLVMVAPLDGLVSPKTTPTWLV